jgi:hypothetical protein
VKLHSINNLDGYSNYEREFDTLKCNVNINEKEVEAIVDTGASMSVIAEELAEDLNIVVDKRKTIELVTSGNHVINTVGYAEKIPIEIDDRIFTCNACVLKTPAHKLLLRNNFLSKNKLLLTLIGT